MKKYFRSLSFLFLGLVFTLALGFFAYRTPNALAQIPNNCAAMIPQTVGNVHGWMWSSTIGWVSYNCKDLQNLFPGVPKYTVNEDPTTGYWTGRAWASTVGWLTFGGLNCADYGIAGSDAASQSVGLRCNLRKMQNGELRGWAKFDSGTSAVNATTPCQGQNPTDSLQSGCWDGLVSFSSQNDSNFTQPTGQIGSIGYGTYQGAPDAQGKRNLYGFAWGSSVVGWLGFCNQANQMILGNTGGNSNPNGPVGPAQSPSNLGGQVINATPFNQTNANDFSQQCSSYVLTTPQQQPQQGTVTLTGGGNYCPVQGDPTLDWNAYFPAGASCVLYKSGSSQQLATSQGDGAYVVDLPTEAGSYYVTCTYQGQTATSNLETVGQLAANDPACTSDPTGPTGPADGTATGPNDPNAPSVASNDNGMCLNQKPGPKAISWSASNVQANSCRILQNGQIVAGLTGLPITGSQVITDPGTYVVQCLELNSPTNWVQSSNTHSFQDCANNTFNFNTSAVALCPNKTATLSWNVGSAVNCSTVGFNPTQSPLPPGGNPIGTQTGVGAGTYELSCNYAQAPSPISDTITIVQLTQAQCEAIDPTGTGPLPGSRPTVREF